MKKTGKRIVTLMLAAMMFVVNTCPYTINAYALTEEAGSGTENTGAGPVFASPSEAEEQEICIETEEEITAAEPVSFVTLSEAEKQEICTETVTVPGNDRTEPAFATLSEAKRKQIFTETVDGITVTVTADFGVFPEDARLCVEKIEKTEDEELDRKLEKAVSRKRRRDTRQSSSFVFDIKMYSGGEEIQPDNDKGSVYVTFTMERALNEVETADIYHIVEEEANEEEELTAEKLEILSEEEVPADEVFAADGALFDESISLTAEIDGFSYYVVEFSYSDLTYEVWCSDDTEIYNNGIIYVHDILEKVGLNVTSLTEASLSDSDAVSLENYGWDEWEYDSNLHEYVVVGYHYEPWENWQLYLHSTWSPEEPVTLTVKTDTSDEYSIKLVCMNGLPGGTAARIGETEYASLHEAFAAAQSGDTVILEKDVSYAFGETHTKWDEDKQMYVTVYDAAVIKLEGRSVTLDFNGHKITTYDDLFSVDKDAELILKDAEIEITCDTLIEYNYGMVTILSTGNGKGIWSECELIYNNFGTLHVVSGTVYMCDALVCDSYDNSNIIIDDIDYTSDWVLIWNLYDNSSVTINGGKFKASEDIFDEVKNQSKITINGGTFTAGNAIIDSTESGTEVTINGGEMKCETYYAIDDIQGKLTITDCSVDAYYGAIYTYNGAEVNISGGTYISRCGDGEYFADSKVTISGGTFRADNCYALYFEDSEAVITGGEFYADNSSISDGSTYYGALVADNSKVTVSGGKFYGHDYYALQTSEGGTVHLSGGEFIGGEGFPAVQPEENGSYDYVTVEEDYHVLPEDWKETEANRIEVVPDEKHIVFLTTKDKEPTEDSEWETWYEETIPKGSTKIANWPEDPEAPDALLYWYGWTDADGKLYDAESSFERDTTLRATWLKRDVTTYTMSYRTGAGEEETDIIMPQDDEGKNGSAYTVADAPTQDGKPERDGYEFIDWTLTWREYYTVFYLDARNGKHLHEPKHVYGVEAGESYTEKAIEIPGYELKDEASKTIEITEDGENRIIFYYKPLASYTVRYLEYGTDKELEIKIKENQVPGTRIKEEAIEIDGYFLAYGEESEKKITLKSDEELGEGGKNEIIFYYTLPTSYKVQYLECQTGKELARPKTVNINTDDKPLIPGITVTEVAASIEGYEVCNVYSLEPEPDNALQKIVLSPKTEDNVITFYYYHTLATYEVHYLNLNDFRNVIDPKIVENQCHAGDTVTESAEYIVGYAFASSNQQTMELSPTIDVHYEMDSDGNLKEERSPLENKNIFYFLYRPNIVQ